MKYFCLFFLIVFTGSSGLFAQLSWPEGIIGGLQHTGAVHFYAEPGTLEVKLYRQGVTGRGAADRGLTAILTGPDGTIHAEEKMSDPGREQLQTVRLRAEVQHAGVFTLLLSANQDQYLTNQQIGFSSNVAKFMINSGVGHADKKREEAIMITGNDRPFSIFFKPVTDVLDISVTHLKQPAEKVLILNSAGIVVRELVPDNGKVSVSGLAAGKSGIWEIRLPAKGGRVLVKGLNDEFPENKKALPVWTTDRKSYFELGDIHWLLAPRRVSAQLGERNSGVFDFTVFNNSAEPMPVDLEIESGSSKFKKLALDQTRVVVEPGKEAKVQVLYESATAAGDLQRFKLIARNRKTGLQTSAFGEVRAAATGAGMHLPIQLRLFEHDQFQFAHKVDYPRDNQFYFDASNRPWMITSKGIRVLSDMGWTILPLPLKGRITYPSTQMGSDKDGNMYAIAECDGVSYLVRVSTPALAVSLLRLPGDGDYYLETFMGGKVSAHLPVLTRYTLDKSKAQVGVWAKVHELMLFVPEVVKGKLSLVDSVKISTNCVGMSAHSGIPNTMASDGDLVHLVWGETSPPERKDPGMPTYSATYDRKTGKLSLSSFLAYSPPVNDVHNISSILVSEDGRRHVIIGAHGRPFQYLSAEPGKTTWSTPVNISKLGQTYIGAVMDLQGRIHLVCRVWRAGEDFKGKFEAALYYQRMNADGHWNEQVPMALPPLPGYSIYYHRVMMDRRGSMLVSFGYWSTWSAYRESYRDAPSVRNLANFRMVLVSSDGGHWNTLTGDALEKGIQKDAWRREGSR